MTLGIISIFVLIVLVGGSAFFLLQIKPRKSLGLKDLYSEGLDMLVSGHRKGAYQNFKSIVQKDTENIKAYLKLGQVAREGGNAEQALKIHKSLLLRTKMTPFEQIEMHKNLALDYYNLGHLDSAIDETCKILDQEKKNEWALSQLVMFYREFGDWKKAGEYLVRLQNAIDQIDDRKVGLYKIQEGRISLEKSQFDTARSLFQEALRIEETLGTAYYFLGNSFVEESEQSYELSVRIDERSSQSVEDQKQYNESLEKAKILLSKAIPMWTRFTEMEPHLSWMVIPKLKDALFAMERYNEIESILKLILTKDSDNTDALATLADFYHHRGDVREAIELIESAIEKDNDSLIARIIRLKLKMQSSDSRKINIEMDTIIEMLTTSRDRYFKYDENEKSDMGWLLETSGQPDKYIQ